MTPPVTLRFDLVFHGPFHVARGQARAGLDRSVDREALLPATSLKGLLRAEAREVLGLPTDVIQPVFGGTDPSPWAWSDTTFAEASVRRAARIRMDESAEGQVEDDFLMLGESVWAQGGHFTVEQQKVLDADQQAQHILVLTAAALSVSALGGGRRRGEGWVRISRPGFSWSDDDTRSLLALRKAAS